MRAVVVVDLGFGDAGKGSVTDYLVRKHDAVAVVRYNGGPQAAHRVVLDDGREHVFAQFGSGTFVPGVQTFLSRFMLVNPLNLYTEEEHLRNVGVTDALERLAVDERALVITPFHKAANQIREIARGLQRHGSCGQGIGEAVSDALAGRALRVGDLRDKGLRQKLLAIQEAKMRELDPIYEMLEDRALEQVMITGDPPGDATDAPKRWMLEDPAYIDTVLDGYEAFVDQVRIVDSNHLQALHDEGSVIYEGAQGVLLDQDYGFHPYTTWARTTYANATELIKPILFAKDWMTLGVLRAYGTRHGPGPFPTEDLALDLPDAVNDLNRWQGSWRLGHFDPLLARYAIAASGGIDGIALTCLDRIETLKLCTSYDYDGTLPDLAAYFARSTTGGFTDLRVGKHLDSHAHAEALTSRLIDCKPQYATYHRDDAPSVVSEALRRPVVLISYGPTASDKIAGDKSVSGNSQKREAQPA